MFNCRRHPDGKKKYHLKFEIQSYDEQILLVSTAARKVRTKLMQQHFRNWAFVPAEDLINAKMEMVVDNDGSHFVSDTRFYIPFWLQNDDRRFMNMALPIDKYLHFSVENEEEMVYPKSPRNVRNRTCLSIVHTDAEHRNICTQRNGATNELPLECQENVPESSIASIPEAIQLPRHYRQIKENEQLSTRGPIGSPGDTEPEERMRKLANNLEALDAEFCATPCKPSGMERKLVPNVLHHEGNRPNSASWTNQNKSISSTAPNDVDDESENQLNVFSFLHWTTDINEKIERNGIFSSTMIGAQSKPFQCNEKSLVDCDNEQATSDDVMSRNFAPNRPTYETGNRYDSTTFLEHYKNFRENLYKNNTHFDDQINQLMPNRQSQDKAVSKGSREPDLRANSCAHTEFTSDESSSSYLDGRIDMSPLINDNDVTADGRN